MRWWTGSKKCSGRSGVCSSSITLLSSSTAPTNAASASILAGSARMGRSAAGRIRRASSAIRLPWDRWDSAIKRPLRAPFEKACARLCTSPFRLRFCCECERNPRAMADHRICDIALDDATILIRNEDIEQERKVSINNKHEENTFKPQQEAENSGEPRQDKHAVRDG